MSDDKIQMSEEKYVPTPAQKKLLRLVYTMGLALALLFLLLIAGLVWKSQKPKPVTTAADLSIGLGVKSSDIKSTELNNGQMAITTNTEIIVIDVSKRKVLLREKLGQ